MNIYEKLKNGYYVSEAKYPPPVSNSCPHCGNYSGAGVKFCIECGFYLSAFNKEQIEKRTELIKIYNQENKYKLDLFKKD
ncbi:MAG: hypothetical protein WC055_00005, partial [Melioribacteraceae bacterium]